MSTLVDFITTKMNGVTTKSPFGDLFECGSGGVTCDSHFYYPDPVTKRCPPSSAPAGSTCVSFFNRQRDDQWMHVVPLDPAAPNSIPIDVTLQGLGQLIPAGSISFHLDLNRSTGAVTATSLPNPYIQSLSGTCLTLAAGAQTNPTFCWQAEILPPAPPPPKIIDLFLGPTSTFVTFHLPPAPPSPDGAVHAGEIRFNWTGGPPPPPLSIVSAAAAPSAAAAVAAPATATAPQDSEEQLSEVAAQMTAAQHAVFETLLPLRPVVSALADRMSIVVHSGAPAAIPPSVQIEELDDPAQEQERLSVLRSFCGALAGQSPTGQGSCSGFLPSTVLTNTGTPAATGWYTAPVTVTLQAIDVGGVGVDHTEYSFDDLLWNTYAAPFDVPEGDVTIYYRSVDEAGRIETTQQAFFKVDTRAPSSSASATAGTTTVALSFTVTDPSPGSGALGLFSTSKVGNTTGLVTQFTPGASGTVSLQTVCTDIEYWAKDVAGNLEGPHRHLADSKPPVLVVPADVTTSTCAATTTVTVGQATATDECRPPATPIGQLIAVNGVPLAVPVPVVGGQVTLGVGTNTIRWTASDGTNTTSRTQSVVVGSKVQTSNTFLVDDRASILINGGGFGAVLNSGVGSTVIGNNAQSGTVLSAAPVRVLHRAVVTGDVRSASSVFKETDGSVTGLITPFQPVVLPTPPSLPSFPTPTGGPFTVDGGTLSRNPGSYSTAVVINGGTLVLGAGDYYFQSLTINSNVTVRVASTTRIFVRDTLTFRSSFRASSGTAVQAIFLGFAGSTLAMETRFDGTLVAPNATTTLGVNTSITFTGSFYARSLELRPDSIIQCR